MKHLERALDNQNQIWKYIVVLIFAFLVAGIIGSLPLFLVAIYKSISSGISMDTADIYTLLSGVSSNLLLLLMMLPLVLGLFAMIWCLPAFHKRTIREVINGTNHIRWGHFFMGAAVWAAILSIASVIDYALDPDNFVLQFQLSSFIPLLIISLAIIPLQTTFEEVVFRGYMAQGIAAQTGSRWLAMIFPSILFGLLHSFNPEIDAYGFWVMMPQYIFMGLMLGLVSILDDGIETAMGVHAANNVFIALFITNSSSAFQTAAVFEQLVVDPSGGLPAMVISFGILVFILKQKYNWDFSVLNRKVQRQIPAQEADNNENQFNGL